MKDGLSQWEADDARSGDVYDDCVDQVRKYIREMVGSFENISSI